MLIDTRVLAERIKKLRHQRNLTQEELDELLKQEQEAITFLKEQGLTVIEPDLDAFMEYSENYYLNDKDMVKDWDMDLYHQIKDLKY